jgi:hypothetical protein
VSTGGRARANCDDIQNEKEQCLDFMRNPTLQGVPSSWPGPWIDKRGTFEIGGFQKVGFEANRWQFCRSWVLP